jgi:HSP20 family molecular chaperone IbpA
MNTNNPKDFPDIHAIMDEIFATAEDIRNAVANEMGLSGKKSPFVSWSEQRDYYPAYSYPPLNVYMTQDKSVVFQFALAGFEEKDISLEFRGDYMVFAAKAPEIAENDETVRYLKRRLKLKSIEEQKYYVPADKFAQEKTKAMLRQAILTVTVPAKDEVEEPQGFSVPIMSQDGE